MMTEPSADDDEIGSRLNRYLAQAGSPQLAAETLRKFVDFLVLLRKWNARTNISSIRDIDGILQRHFVESIECASALPKGINTLLDFGSGGGFPGIPIALCRPEIAVTLADSHGKKAAFLQEATRELGISATVHYGRAEQMQGLFDAVTLRAVERMQEAVHAASTLVAPSGWLILMTTDRDWDGLTATSGVDWTWTRAGRLGDAGVIALGGRKTLS
jgi:16S rRNA (guanine527-N7)-methyltransferase